MIIFDQLRLSDDGTWLYINAHVNTADRFKDIYIDSIHIMTADRVSETNPNIYTEDCIYEKTFDGEQKEIALALQKTDFNKAYLFRDMPSDADPAEYAKKVIFTSEDMESSLFFVYIKCKGTINGSVPCMSDEPVTLGVTFDEKLLYQRVMDYTKQLADDCNTPAGFIDFILLWNAFKASVETDHYVPAIKYWNMLFDTGADNYRTKGCGCHG